MSFFDLKKIENKKMKQQHDKKRIGRMYTLLISLFFSFVAICFSIENVQLFSLSQCFACAIIVDKTAALQKKCYQYIFFFSPNAHSQSGKKALRKKWWKNHCSPTMVQCGSFFRDTYSVRLGRHTSSYKCTNKQQRLFDKKKSSSSNSNS